MLEIHSLVYENANGAKMIVVKIQYIWEFLICIFASNCHLEATNNALYAFHSLLVAHSPNAEKLVQAISFLKPDTAEMQSGCSAHT